MEGPWELERLWRESSVGMHMSVPPYLRVGGIILTRMVLGMGEMLSRATLRLPFKGLTHNGEEFVTGKWGCQHCECFIRLPCWSLWSLVPHTPVLRFWSLQFPKLHEHGRLPSPTLNYSCIHAMSIILDLCTKWSWETVVKTKVKVPAETLPHTEFSLLSVLASFAQGRWQCLKTLKAIKMPIL